MVMAKDKNELEEDVILDETLRPKKLKEFVGQEEVKNNLEIFLAAAKERGTALEHILIYGPPGLGKTTLANIIAREINKNIKTTSGPAIERTGDLASILTNLEDGDVLFIDEIHRLHRVIEEVLYPAMEDYALDLVIGKGPAAKTLRLDLPKFTLVGATTRLAALSSPLRDRFGVVYHLEFYRDEDLEKILHRSAKILKIKIDNAGIAEIAKRSRKTPRVANRLLKRVRDYAQVKKKSIMEINKEIVDEALKMLAIDEIGLDKIDRAILKTIAEKFRGGPVGVETIAAATGQERGTIEDVIEPYLLQIGFLERTPRGRKITSLAGEHLNLSKQKKLL